MPLPDPTPPRKASPWLHFLGGIAFTVGMLLLFAHHDPLGGDARRLAELIRAQYVDPLAAPVLRERMLKGIAAELDDHSYFMTAGEYRDFQRDMHAESVGIGVRIDAEPEGFRVRRVIAGSGAAEAGLRRGDLLLRAGDLDLARRDMSTEAKLEAILGAPGTSLTLRVRRDGQDFERQAMRKALVWPSVRADAFRHRGRRIGYFVIEEFKSDSAEEFARRLAERIDQLDALVLDVGDNPGGYLDAAVDIAGLFLPADSTVAWILDRHHPQGERLAVTPDKAERWQGRLTPAQLARAEALPLVLLFNDASASASEVLAGALGDHARATLAGTRTYGKGTVQSLFDLSDGEALKLTTARYLTPHRQPVEGRGILPGLALEADAPPAAPLAFEQDGFFPDEYNAAWLYRAAEHLTVDTRAAAGKVPDRPASR